MKKYCIALSLVGALVLSAAAEDPFQGRIQAIERAARVLTQAPTNTADPLTWGQNLAREDLVRLGDAAEALRKRIDEGEEDLDEMATEFQEYQVAAHRVKMSLSLARVEGEAQTFSQGLAQQMDEVEKMVAEQRQREEQARIARAARNTYYSNIGWGSPWGIGFGSPWGWGMRSGFGFGLGWGRSWGRRCR